MSQDDRSRQPSGPDRDHRDSSAAGNEEDGSARRGPVFGIRRVARLSAMTGRVAASYLVHGLRDRMGRERPDGTPQQGLLDAHVRNAHRVVRTLGELKGPLMKIGQILSSQHELLPRDFIDVVAQLQSEAPPMHYSLVRTQIRSQLGSDPEDLFGEFGNRPFAAASLGQVHEARLKTGERAAVKVQYPGMDSAVRSDLRSLKLILKQISLAGDRFDYSEAYEEIQERILEEIDYRNEVENLELFARLFDDDTSIVVPRVFRQLSTEKVLTMEFLDGTPLGKRLNSELPQDEANRIASLLSAVFWRQVLIHGCVHADPHPGNFLLMDQDRLGIVDFGCVKRLDAAFHDSYRRVLQAAMEGDEERMDEWYVEVGLMEAGDNRKSEAFRRFTRFFLEPVMEDREYSFDRQWLLEEGRAAMEQIASTAGLKPPKDLVFMNRVAFGLFGIYLRLGARINWHRIMMRYLYDTPRRP